MPTTDALVHYHPDGTTVSLIGMAMDPDFLSAFYPLEAGSALAVVANAVGIWAMAIRVASTPRPQRGWSVLKS